MHTLTLENIRKSFGEKEVLKGFSFTAAAGEAYGLLGRNGAGKTTTLRILMGVFPPNSGRVLVDGAPIDYKKTGIGYLPEERGLYPKQKIIDQLTYFARLKGLGASAAVNSVDRWLERLEMTEYRNKRLDTLSKGNQQKIQLITALAHDPEIVILDEPFSGLDPVNARLLKDVVREQLEAGKCVIFSSHQMNYIEEFCDSIAILNGGEAVISGSLREIKRSQERDKLLCRTESPERILRDFGDRAAALPGGEVIVRMEGEERRALMSRLIEVYGVEGVEVYEPTLNDIFVKYASDRV